MAITSSGDFQSGGTYIGKNLLNTPEARTLIRIEKGRKELIQRAREGSGFFSLSRTKGIKKTEWFIKKVNNQVKLTMKKRVRIATEFLKDKTIVNIKRPVKKRIGNSGGMAAIIVTNRSKPGEFPKADTTQLMKTLFTTYRSIGSNIHDGYLGTPLDYGVKLELQMDRSWLVRTFMMNKRKVLKILTGPLKFKGTKGLTSRTRRPKIR